MMMSIEEGLVFQRRLISCQGPLPDGDHGVQVRSMGHKPSPRLERSQSLFVPSPRSLLQLPSSYLSLGSSSSYRKSDDVHFQLALRVLVARVGFRHCTGNTCWSCLADSTLAVSTYLRVAIAKTRFWWHLFLL